MDTGTPHVRSHQGNYSSKNTNDVIIYYLTENLNFQIVMCFSLSTQKICLDPISSLQDVKFSFTFSGIKGFSMVSELQ